MYRMMFKVMIGLMVGGHVLLMADVVFVSGSKELVKAVASAQEPRDIVLASGVYGGGIITLEGNRADVTIAPAEDFKVHFQSEIRVYGDKITITKCVFDGRNYRERGIYIRGDDCKILRNDFNNPNAKDWIKIETDAHRTEIGYNWFRNRPADIGNSHHIILSLHDDNEKEQYAHHIHHNYFKDIARCASYSEIYLSYTIHPKKDNNAPFSIDHNIVFEYNLFDHATGDGKAIDMKTNGMIARYNTFINGSGASIVMRNTKNSAAYNNVFIAPNTGSIAMNHQNNMVYNNYIDLTGSKQRRGIQLFVGADKADGVTKKQLIHCKIFNNTIIGADKGIDLGKTGPNQHRPIKDTWIVNNLLINCYSSFYGNLPPVDSIVSHNVIYKDGGGNKFPSYGIEVDDLEMVDVLKNGILHPVEGSVVANKGMKEILQYAPKGVQHTSRFDVPSIGATEVSSSRETKSAILTAEEVGPYAEEISKTDGEKSNNLKKVFVMDGNVLY